MSRRGKFWAAGALALLTLGLIEAGVQMAREARTSVTLINGGQEALRGVRASYGGIQAAVGDLPPGASTLVRLESAPGEDVVLSYEQDGNPAAGITVAAGELAAMRRDGLRMVLTLNPGQVVRYMEADPEADGSPLLRLWRRFLDALSADPSPTPTPSGRRTLRGLLGVGLPDAPPRGILSVRMIA